MEDYTPFFQSAAQEHGEDPLWLQAMALQESKNNPNAVSKAGARGVMQLMPGTAQDMGVQNINDPAENIAAGAKYYAQNKQKYKNPNVALMAYNWGGGNYDNWVKKGAAPEEVPTETKDYVRKVNDYYRNLKQKASAPTQNQTQVAQNLDPIEQALIGDDNEKNLSPVHSSSAGNLDPIEQALAADYEEDKPKPPPISVPEDLAKTAPSSVVKGIGTIPQVLGYGVNALANTMGEGAYGVNRLLGAPKDEALYHRLTNINPIGVGNTLPDTLIKAAANVGGVPMQDNPLSGGIVHNPETMPGRYENALIQTMIAGKSGTSMPSAKTLPLIGGALGAQTASEAFPGSPTAQLVGGAIGSGIPTALQSTKFRSTPNELADKALQETSGTEIEPNKLISNEIVPGSKPTLAQITNDPNVALIERQLQAKNPNAFKALEDVNEEARQQHFSGAAGTAADIEALESKREAISSPLYEQARKQALDVNAIHPVLSKIDAAIEEVGEGSEAGKTLASIKTKIENALPSTDEATGKTRNSTQSPLVQIYREERDNLQKPATAQGAYAGTVKSVIQPIVKELGGAIESQSEPFAKAQQAYRDISPTIESAKWLQGLKLTDASGRFTLAKVKNALENAKRLQGSSALHPAKSLTSNQMDVLQNIHDDLLRRENVARASMPRGSNTVQNSLASAELGTKLGKTHALLGTNIPEVVGSGVGAGVGSLVGMPGVGAFGGDIAARFIRSASQKRNAAAVNALENYVLNPEQYKQYLLNSSKDTFANRFQKNLLTQP